MIDNDNYAVVPLKTNVFQTFVLGTTTNINEARQYIPDGKIPVLEVVCTDGVFFILIDADDYVKMD